MATHLAAVAIDTIAAMHPSGTVLRRPTVGAYVNGRWVAGPDEADLDFVSTVHAMTAKDLQDLPDGMRHDDMRVIHARTELRVHTDDAAGDVVVYNGRDYKILQVRERFEGSFYRAIMGHNHVRTNTI